jgi:6-phosphogluconolactonase
MLGRLQPITVSTLTLVFSALLLIAARWRFRNKAQERLCDVLHFHRSSDSRTRPFLRHGVVATKTKLMSMISINGDASMVRKRFFFLTCLTFLTTLSLSVGSLAATKVARYGYSVAGFSVIPYAVDPVTGYLRFFTAEQDLSGPPCSEYDALVAPSQRFFYFVSSCGQILATRIGANGILTPINGSPFTISTATYQMVFTPSGKFAYATDYSNSPQIAIIPVAVNTATGALTPLSTSASYTASNTPKMVMDPQGKFLYVFNQFSSSGVYVFALNPTTGAVTEVAGSPFSTGGMEVTSLAAYAAGSFVIATNYQSASMSVFKVNRTTGVLTLAAGSPHSTPGYPYSVAVDPASPHFVYAGYASFNSNISVFRLSAKGALTEVPGSPFQTLGGRSASLGLRSDPTGHFLYSLTGSVGGGGNWEQVLSVNQTTGALTPLQTIALPFGGGFGPIFTTGTTPLSFAPTYAYAANSPAAPPSSQDGIAEYSINPTSGALTQLGTAVDSSGPRQLLVSPTGNDVYYTNSLATGGYNVLGNGSLQVFTVISASGTAILEDTNGAGFYIAGGGAQIGDWSLDQSTGQFGTQCCTYYFTGNVVGLANSVGVLFDYVVTADSAIWEVYPRSNTGAKYGPFPVGNSPSAIATDGGGRFIYVANGADNTLSGFAIPNDPLKPLSGAPFTTGTTPSAIAGDPYGFYLYVANSGSHDLWAYSIDPASGSLTPIGSPVAVGNGPISLNVDYSGKFLYCANSGEGTISTFTINADGTLTPSGSVTVDSTLLTPAPTSIVTTGTYK